MLVGREEQWRFSRGYKTENVSVLRLRGQYQYQLCSTDKSGTHVIVGKHQPLVEVVCSSILLVQPLPVFLNRLPEEIPRNTTNKATLPPQFEFRSCLRVWLCLLNPFIKPFRDVLTPVDPLIPVAPDERSIIALLRKKINTLMKLAHALSDLYGGFRVAEVLARQCTGIEKLLEATVREGAKKTGANLLPSQATKDLELRFAIDEMLDLRAVDSKKKFTRTTIRIR